MGNKTLASGVCKALPKGIKRISQRTALPVPPQDFLWHSSAPLWCSLGKLAQWMRNSSAQACLLFFFIVEGKMRRRNETICDSQSLLNGGSIYWANLISPDKVWQWFLHHREHFVCQFGLSLVWAIKEPPILPAIPQSTQTLCERNVKKKRKILSPVFPSTSFQIETLFCKLCKEKWRSHDPSASWYHILLIKRDLSVHVLHQPGLSWFLPFHLKKT